MKKIGLYKIRMRWLLICIFTSNISQCPQLIEMKAFKVINITCWIILFLMNIPLIIKKSFLQNKIVFKVILSFVFYIVFLLICQLIKGEGYIVSYNLYSITLAIFTFFNAYFVFDPNDKKAIKSIFIAYTISGLIMLLSVYFKYYSSITIDMLSWQYAYSEKNTIAIIDLFVLVNLYLIKNKRIAFRIGKYALTAFLIYFLIILKSRAAIVGGIFALICHMFLVRTSKRIKVSIALISIVGLLAILVNKNLYNLFVINLFLNGKVENGSIDLSMATSSRFDHFNYFIDSFKENFLIGRGFSEIESGFLYSLTSYGILGSIPYIKLAIQPFLSIIKKVKQMDNIISLALLYCSAISLVNFLLEHYAPFGPGTKFSFLWIVFGIFARSQEVKNNCKGGI